MQLDQDTIVAISTPPGRGGIGIVRLSGTEAQAIVEPMLRLRVSLVAGRVHVAKILDEQGMVLDEALVTYFQAPHSYTAEDVIEIAAHGSPVLLDHLLRAAILRGARLAEPGEFTQRAFLNGRLDLTQAEAVSDLIKSQTLHQARLAAAQLGGSLARVIGPTKQSLIELIAALEAGIDFAEDDLDLLPTVEITARLEEANEPLRRLAASYAYGRIVREGFTLAIVGRPNAGKSSLFNRLLERDRAIVTAQPGTTRDPIVERWSLNGIPVELVDTAGLRDVPAGREGEAETAGILRTHTIMAEADLVLLVLDAAQPESFSAEDAKTLRALEARPYLIVLNKVDLVLAPRTPEHLSPLPLHTSTVSGEGLEELKQAIVDRLTGTSVQPESALLTNLRQHGAIVEAIEALARARTAVEQTLPHELLLLDLYQSLTALDTLTGATTSEDILRLIFSTFCIGK